MKRKDRIFNEAVFFTVGVGSTMVFAASVA
jgi:hypothetical protein